DKQLHAFSGVLIRHANGSCFENVRMFSDDSLEFVRVNVETRHHDHVFLAVLDEDVALFVHQTNIAGTKKAVLVEGFLSFFRPVPVTWRDRRPRTQISPISPIPRFSSPESRMAISVEGMGKPIDPLNDRDPRGLMVTAGEVSVRP